MDPIELARLLVILRGHVKAGKIKSSRSPAQKADIEDREVQSVWHYLTDGQVEEAEFPATAEEAKETVIGCTTLVMGEKPALPDNRLGPCQWGCGRTIQWRPYVPDYITRACLYCMAERLEQGDQ